MNMSDKLNQKVSEERNWVEKITEQIPLYSGYQSKERRREVDKILRGEIAVIISRIMDRMKKIMLEFTDAGIIQILSRIDRSIRELEYMRDKINTASYGYSGFFDSVKIGEQELSILHQQDYTIFLGAKDLLKKLETYKMPGTLEISEITSSMDAWINSIEELKKNIINRESVIIQSKGL